MFGNRLHPSTCLAGIMVKAVLYLLAISEDHNTPQCSGSPGKHVCYRYVPISILLRGVGGSDVLHIKCHWKTKETSSDYHTINVAIMYIAYAQGRHKSYCDEQFVISLFYEPRLCDSA